MSELKPCPFCGGCKIVNEEELGVTICYGCSAETDIFDWNNRPIEDALNARIAELERDVKWREESISTIEHALANNEDDIEMLESRIAELEAVQRWIPVSERLPDTKILYDKFDVIVELVDIGNGEMIRRVDLLSYDYRNKSWNDDCGEFGFYPVTGITHWRERPTPPEVTE